MNKLYAVVYEDNEFYGKLQFCNVASDEEYLHGDGTNITEDLAHAQQIAKECLLNYPECNYRAVEIVMKEVEVQQFLTDVVTAAGLLSHGKTDKVLARRISEFAYKLM